MAGLSSPPEWIFLVGGDALVLSLRSDRLQERLPIDVDVVLSRAVFLVPSAMYLLGVYAICS